MTRDIHQQITDQIVTAIEAGAAPWRQDWTATKGGSIMPTRSTGEAYNGINVLVLWCEREAKGFTGNQWMTFKQALALGGCVRKGEKGSQVVYASTFEKEREDGEKDRIPFMKAYTVFNVDQIDDLPASYYPVNGDQIDTGARAVEELEAFFAATGATIKNSGRNPCYMPQADEIHMPVVSQFETAAAYYGTLAHELIHWTGATPRLDRDMKYNTTEGRAFEELIAEIGACFLCAHIGATPDRDNSAAYVASWLKALKSDKRFIFRAASQAQRAADYALQRGRPQLAAPHAIAAE